MPPKTRRPRTCLADCVGMRRWPLVMATTATPRRRTGTISTMSFSKLMSLAAAAAEREDRLLERGGRARTASVRVAAGMRATMPAMMMRLMPLPMPYSSICSPSHIRKTVPAVMVMTARQAVERSCRSRSARPGRPLVCCRRHDVLHPHEAPGEGR